MKKLIFAVLATATLAATGCVKTVSDTHSFATTWGKDSVAGRYQRPPEKVYAASPAEQSEQVEFVRSILGKVNDRKIWVRVEAVDAKTSQVDVQARTKWGTRDLDLVHQLEKEIALKLASQQ